MDLRGAQIPNHISWWGPGGIIFIKVLRKIINEGSISILKSSVETIVPRLELIMEDTATEMGPVRKKETMSQAFQ